MHIFSGIYKGRAIKSPKGLDTRPTSGRLRETFFNICRHEIDNARFLDLFAGSGAMGLEALSQGASKAVFVDISRESVRCIQDNIKTLELGNQCEVICGDVFSILKRLAKRGDSYDIIYADPPYDKNTAEKKVVPYSVSVLEFIDQLIREGVPLLAPGGSLFLEDAAGAVSKAEPPEFLKLKTARKSGRSELHHFVSGGI